MSKIAIFASGTGSNAEQIIRFLKEKDSLVEINVILTNKKQAGIYTVASDNKIEIKYFENKVFEEADEVVNFLKKREVKWIVLAGFLRKIEPPFLKEFTDKIINLHPSLLPKFGGKGMYGSHVHQAVIDSGEKESGISIHLVNAEFDKGKILFQASCKVEKGQTVEELNKNIQKLEHSYFPKVVEETILS